MEEGLGAGADAPQRARQTPGPVGQALLAGAPPKRLAAALPLGGEERVGHPALDERLDAVALDRGGESLVLGDSLGPQSLVEHARMGAHGDHRRRALRP